MANNPAYTETETHVFHHRPRISAAKLAEYVVASPARQKAIVRDSKKAPKSIMIPYKRVRNAVQSAFRQDGLNAEYFIEQADQCETTPFESEWAEADNKRSAEALRHLATITPEINFSGANLVRRPGNSWGGLMISGVRVSINPELVFSLLHKKVKKYGAVILNTGKSENLSLRKNNGKHCAGDYLATLVYRLLERRACIPLHTKCYAVDIFREEIYTAPLAYKTLTKNIEAACEMIALLWESIPVDIVPVEVDEI